MKSRQASACLDIDLCGRRRLARAMDRLAGPEQRLGRDARPVGALAADELALDDGDPQAALGECAGAVLAGRAGAEDDDVVVAVHRGAAFVKVLAKLEIGSRKDLDTALRSRGPEPALSPAAGARSALQGGGRVSVAGASSFMLSFTALTDDMPAA